MSDQSTVIPVGICVYCADPRDHLWKHTKMHLIPPGNWYVALGILGGATPLAHPKDLEMQFHALLVQIHFAQATFTSVSRLMLIGHNCGYYTNIGNREFNIESKRSDMAVAAKMAHKHFPDLRISAYFKEPRSREFTKVA